MNKDYSMFMVRLGEADRRKLDLLADARGVSRGAAVRELIDLDFRARWPLIATSQTNQKPKGGRDN